MRDRRTGQRKRPRNHRQATSNGGGPMRIWIAGFLTQENGVLTLTTSAVPNPGVVKTSHKEYHRGEKIPPGEKRWLGFKDYDFPDSKHAPSRLKIQRMAEEDFKKLLALL